MGEISIRTAKFNRTARFSTNDGIWKIAKFLPYLLFLGFIWQNVYAVLSGYDANSIAQGNAVAYILLDLVFYAAIDYLAFLVILWVYRTILETKVYFFLTSKRTFNTKFKFWIFIETLIMGAIYFIQFWCPQIAIYLPIIKMILSFLVIVCTFYSLQENIGVLFKHMYFKSLMWPWFVYQILVIAVNLLVGGV